MPLYIAKIIDTYVIEARNKKEAEERIKSSKVKRTEFVKNEFIVKRKRGEI